MDPFVIPLPFFIRFLLVYFIIVPFRAKNSAKAYSKIWTPEGSPLRFHSENLLKKLSAHQNDSFQFFFATTYGEPSFKTAVKNISNSNCEQVLLLPLFPQYSSATTEACIFAFKKQLKKQKLQLDYYSINHFHSEASYLNSVVESCEKIILKHKPEHLLFSYHGLPVAANENRSPIDNKKYSDHCEEQYKSITKKLGDSITYSFSYQSRLGRNKWLEPSTDSELKQLGSKGLKKIAVACPSFVTDCVETLEEIQIQGEETFIESGGDELFLVPSLNSSDVFVQSIWSIVNNEELYQ